MEYDINNRIAIYLFYDIDGIVDDYVTYYLRGLREVCSKIIVVCNGQINHDGYEKISSVADDIFIRENIGFDGWAFKETIEKKIGYTNLLNYSELIITNNTVYGPLYPFSEMFKKMETSHADFWGATKRFEDKNAKTFQGRKTKYGYIPDFIPSNFWVIRESLLHSREFRFFWQQLPKINDYLDSCLLCEPVFAYDMQKYGYTMDSYMTDDRRDVCQSPTETDTLYEISQERIPIVRRKAFCNPLDINLRVEEGKNGFDTLNYIKNSTLYDVDMIYSNLIRTANIYNVNNRLMHKFIIENNRFHNETDNKSKIAFVYYFSKDNLHEFNIVKRSIFNFPLNTEIFLISSKADIIDKVKTFFLDCNKYKIEIIGVDARGGWLTGLFRGFSRTIKNSNYDFICFGHTLEYTNSSWYKNKEIDDNHCAKTMFGSDNIINEIQEIFFENKNIGLLFPENPYWGKDFDSIGGGWGSLYSDVKKLSMQMNLRTPMDENTPPIYSKYGYFWFRPQALIKLFNIKYDLSAIDDTNLGEVYKHIIPYVAQEAGYYSANILLRENIVARVTSLSHMLDGINSAIRKKHRESNGYSHQLSRLNSILEKEISNTRKPMAKDNIESNYIKFKKAIKSITPPLIWEFLRRIKRKRLNLARKKR